MEPFPAFSGNYVVTLSLFNVIMSRCHVIMLSHYQNPTSTNYLRVNILVKQIYVFISLKTYNYLNHVFNLISNRYGILLS